MTWFAAAQYCRWLSEQEGIPEDQRCYPPIDEIKDGMGLPDGFLSRTGYRLPTEAEWEYACRAGAVTSRPYGGGDDLLDHYAWYDRNARGRAGRVGSLKPNDLGMFDMLGNAWEWCHDARRAVSAEPAEDQDQPGTVTAAQERGAPGRRLLLRGAGPALGPSDRVPSAGALRVWPASAWPGPGGEPRFSGRQESGVRTQHDALTLRLWKRVRGDPSPAGGSCKNPFEKSQKLIAVERARRLFSPLRLALVLMPEPKSV